MQLSECLQTLQREGIFTSPEIILPKKFKQSILGKPLITDRFCLLVVDEIHLIEEWSKNFCPMYAEIKTKVEHDPLFD